MRKTLLSFCLSALCAYHGQSQVLYSNTATTGYTANLGLGSQGTPKVVMDDVEVPSALVAGSDSVAITKLKFAIARPANGSATTVNFYYSAVEDTATQFGTLFTVPKLIGTASLPANGAAAQAYIVSLGDSVMPLFKVKTDTGAVYTGFQTFFAGLSFSTNEGAAWMLADGGNADAMWIYDADLAGQKRYATWFGGPPNPAAAFYLQVFGFPLKDATLPVTIVGFDGTMTDAGTSLAWAASNGTSNQGFFIERGNDGINFSTIGYIAGKEGQAARYTFADGAPLPGKNLYRLRQVSTDGTKAYSRIITLDWDRVNWTVYPNPSHGKVTVSLSLDAPSKVSLRLLGMDGRVHANIEKGVLGTGGQQISLNPPARGLYRVQLTVGGKVYFKTISRL